MAPEEVGVTQVGENSRGKCLRWVDAQPRPALGPRAMGAQGHCHLRGLGPCEILQREAGRPHRWAAGGTLWASPMLNGEVQAVWG